MSSVNYGTKRIVTGAHYGARDWLVQRASAVVIIAFTAIILAQLLLTKGPIGYELWAGIFCPSMDEVHHRQRHRLGAVARLGRGAQRLDGLCACCRSALYLAILDRGMARGLRCLGL